MTCLLPTVLLRRIALGALLVGIVLVGGCQPGICDDVPTERTERHVISVDRGTLIAAAADGGPTCRDECETLGSTGASACSVGGAVDGGVLLACQVPNFCR